MLHPACADLRAEHLWECEGEVGESKGPWKVGCTRLTTLRRLPLPEISAAQRVRFFILCGWKTCDDPPPRVSVWRKWFPPPWEAWKLWWEDWARDWLNCLETSQYALFGGRDALKAKTASKMYRTVMMQTAAQVAHRAAETQRWSRELWGFDERPDINLLSLAEQAMREEGEGA